MGNRAVDLGRNVKLLTETSRLCLKTGFAVGSGGLMTGENWSRRC